ncbi:fibrinogen-like protein A [Saccostrea echinata]|uniref:fibrinogen-like protein A n=1 Tax=Saccostrea echinata TaxID=191078 RepID=UPI002A8276AB|nr:fibrinogen-like protein A [Saccostrea echinata]
MCISGNCVPVLEGRTCGSPPVVPNTEQTSPSGPFSVGYTYNYSSCLEGYEPSGELYTTCQDNGKWTPALFRCIADQDCAAILKKNSSKRGVDGVYTIYPDGYGIPAFCDMTTEHGGWTVIQQRQDNSTDFYRTWNEYKQGFGTPGKNHWIGNDVIYHLSKGKNQKLRVNLQSFSGDTAYTEYATFDVGDEASNYILALSGNSGTAGNGMILNDGKKFTTKDRDNDIYEAKNCAEKHHGAWWYHMCGYSNLNGQYGNPNVTGMDYMIWYFWKYDEPLQKSWMMIKTKT